MENLMEKYFPEWEVDHLSKRGCTLYIGENDEFGLAVYYDETYGDTLHIENITVFSERGQGIGTKIMKEIIQWAKENSYDAVALVAQPLEDSNYNWPMSQWAGLLEWYKKLGFEIDKEAEGYDPEFSEEVKTAAENGLKIRDFESESRSPYLVYYI